MREGLRRILAVAGFLSPLHPQVGVEGIYQSLTAAYHQCRGDASRAQASYTWLREHNPDYTSLLYVAFLQGEGRTSEALAAGKHLQALEEKSHMKDWETYHRLATVYDHLGQHSKAEECLMQASALARKPSAIESVAYSRAVFLLQQARYREALESIEHFLESTVVRPRHALFRFLEAHLHLRHTPQEPRKALHALEKGLRLNPDSLRCLKLKAALQEQLGDYKLLPRTLERILALEDSPAYRKKMVSILFAQQRFSEAYTHLMQIDDRSPEHFYDLALLAWKAGTSSQALEHLAQALKAHPRFSKARLLKREIQAEHEG